MDSPSTPGLFRDFLIRSVCNPDDVVHLVEVDSCIQPSNPVISQQIQERLNLRRLPNMSWCQIQLVPLANAKPRALLSKLHVHTH